MARHIHLGESDCSIQRRHQKVMKKHASPVIHQNSGKRWVKHIVKAAATINYKNAGTVEFIFR